MIDVKYSNYLFSFLMALFMSCIMSLVITVFNVGLTDKIFIIWLKAWSFAFIVALPVIIAVSPMVRRLVFLMTKKS